MSRLTLRGPMRRLVRFMLRIVTTAVPVVIAACYGVPYNFTQRGRVVDRDTKQGIGGLMVECRTASDATTESNYSGTDGSFVLIALNAADCQKVAVEDLRDGSTRYAPTSVASNSSSEIIIEVGLQP